METINTKQNVFLFTNIFHLIGVELNLTNKRKLFLNALIQYVFKIAIVINFTYILVNCLIDITNLNRFNKCLWSISIIIKLLLISCGLIYFDLNINKIQKTIINIRKHLSDPDKQKVYRCSKIMIILWVIFELLILICVSTFYVYYPTIKIDLAIDLLYTIQFYGFIIAINILLINICYAVYLMDNRLIIKQNYLLDFKNMREKVLIIERLKQSINESLGIFPFLWFCELFSTTCLRLTHFTVNRLNRQQIHLDFSQGMAEYICIFIANISYILAINYFQTHRPTVNEMMCLYDKTYTPISEIDLLHKIIVKECLKS